MSTLLSLTLSSIRALTKRQRPFLSPFNSFLCQRQQPLGRRMFTVAAEMDGDNWDLGAVVRSCRSSGSAAKRDAVWAFPQLPEPLRAAEGGKGGAFVCLTQALLNQSGSSFPKVHSLPEQETVSWSPRSAAVLGANLLPVRREVNRTPRSRRRQNQRQKKVVRHVAADDLSSDIYAWRKYGQKPIKGSPYPRGYYKCSSSKGCPARKQVERSQADSATLIITYTGEHNHSLPTNCNSLAGSTCSEIPRPPYGGNQEGSPLSFSTTAHELSPTTPLSVSVLSRAMKGEGSVDEAEVEEAEDNEDEGELLVEDMEIISEDDLHFLVGATAPTVADMTKILDGDGDHLFPLL